MPVISVLVYAPSTSICALCSEGVEGVKGSAGACWCASRDGVRCRLGHLELFSWIYCVRGGQGRAAAPPPPAHENFVSIGHEADTRGSDKSLDALRDGHPLWATGHVFSWTSLWHDLGTDWFFLSGCQGKAQGGVLPGDRIEGSTHLPLPHVAIWGEGMQYLRRGKTQWVTTCLTPPLGLLGFFFFPLSLKQDTRPHVFL